ncbi:universal stress protein [Lentilactobacillus diolivorans]|uniref:Universal stress protein n=2 Tax=Lentilactobacillus diolivorans TaxID=179838 RepID=A0A0R1SD59_9LACO|nr:universal stress protein [Lentilactobacillus diolivorans]KRL64522.1 universal stress family protein [Lentilactobacillus diolivorans DSM 14421]GEP22909.1 universal stress protein UspA [Lentilactobacillus diolivorans]
MLEFNYTNILVGVDGSKTSIKAVTKAIAVAKRNQAKLIIAAVINDREFMGVSKAASIGFGNIDPSTIDALKLRYEKMVARYADQARAVHVNVKTIVTFGDPKTVLSKRLVDEEDVDAIVIGATGVNFVSRLMLGSTASFVIAHAPCDVFVVHRD